MFADPDDLVQGSSGRRGHWTTVLEGLYADTIANEVPFNDETGAYKYKLLAEYPTSVQANVTRRDLEKKGEAGSLPCVFEYKTTVTKSRGSQLWARVAVTGVAG